MSSLASLPEPPDWQAVWDHLDAVEGYLKAHASLPSAGTAMSGVLTTRAALTTLLAELSGAPSLPPTPVRRLP